MPLLVHAELIGDPPLAAPATAVECRSYARHLASRPREWEHDAIRLMIELCREFRCHVHIVHLSSADALPMIAQARAEGLPLTVETCPHYLTFAAEEIPDGDPRFKCAPPIRERENRERLWEGLREGLIDTIGTDHSPAPPELKHLDTGDVFRAWGGIASLQLALPAVWTEARRRGFTLADLAALDGPRARRAGRALGLARERSPRAATPTSSSSTPRRPSRSIPTALHHRHRATPYEGRVLDGRVEATYLRGRAVYRAGGLPGPARGQTLLAASRESTRSRLMNLELINAWTDDEARESFQRCCGSSALVRARWHEPGRLNPRRPCSKPPSESGGGSSQADWLEAFAAHPRIGDLDALRAKFAATAAWASREQAGRTGRVGRRARGSRRRQTAGMKQRFGYIFIVCATGKTAEEMLALLKRAARQRPRGRDQARRRRADEDHADSPGKDRPMSPITTHVLDTALGKPARASPSSSRSAREPTAGPSWPAASPTATAGSAQFTPPLMPLKPGVYRLRFFTAAYFTAMGVHGFYPEVDVIVQIDDPAQHYHIPLLLSPLATPRIAAVDSARPRIAVWLIRRVTRHRSLPIGLKNLINHL